jgi:hypothetical protein
LGPAAPLKIANPKHEARNTKQASKHQRRKHKTGARLALSFRAFFFGFFEFVSSFVLRISDFAHSRRAA